MPALKSLLAVALGLLITFGGLRLAEAVTVSEVPRPHVDHNEWIVDLPGILSFDEIDTYNEIITDLEVATGVEIVIVIVDSVSAPTPRDFATELFNDWRIGKEGVDNGLLILFVMDQRRMEMETGYGLEAVLTDGWLARMQRESMVPHFQRSRYGDGIGTGLVAIDARLRRFPDAIGHDSSFLDRPRDFEALRSRPPVPVIVGGVLGLLSALFGGLFFVRRRRRYCTNCKQMMVELPPGQATERLTRAQRHEHDAGSMTFQVYQCEGCSRTRTFERSKMNSKAKVCPSCGFRTVETSSRIVQEPTHDSHGFRELTDECRNCSHKSHRQVVVNRKASLGPRDDRRDDRRRSGSGGSRSTGGSSRGSGRSSSGRSSSGRNRGGGRSGGGGAGSSW